MIATTIDDIIAALDGINDRAELLALLAPLRLPTGLPEHDRGRLTDALVAAASRCWKGRMKVSRLTAERVDLAWKEHRRHA